MMEGKTSDPDDEKYLENKFVWANSKLKKDKTKQENRNDI